MTQNNSEFYSALALKYKQYWDEAREENDFLADDNLRLEEEVQGHSMQLESMRHSRDSVRKSLTEMTEKHSHAVCDRGLAESQLALLKNPCCYDVVQIKVHNEGLESRIKELKESYDELEQIREDESISFQCRIGELGSELKICKNKYDQLYYYVCDKARDDAIKAGEEAKKASLDWNNLESGEYPWEEA